MSLMWKEYAIDVVGNRILNNGWPNLTYQYRESNRERIVEICDENYSSRQSLYDYPFRDIDFGIHERLR